MAAAILWLGPYLVGLATGLCLAVYEMGSDVWPLAVAIAGSTFSYYVHTRWL
jgi:hypothetical protein